MKRLIAILAAFLATTASAQWAPGFGVQNNGAFTGNAQRVNCTGTGITCSTNGGTWTLNVTGGAVGGGSGLPADPAACPANQYVIDQNASGVLTCSQVGWSQLGAVPTTFTPSTHAATHAAASTDPVTLSESQVTNLTTDLAAKAPLASPSFTGTITQSTGAGQTLFKQFSVGSVNGNWFGTNADGSWFIYGGDNVPGILWANGLQALTLGTSQNVNAPGTLSEAGSRVWTAATFDPTTKANLSGATFTNTVGINLNAAPFPTPFAGTYFQLAGPDLSTTRASIISYNGSPVLDFRRSNNTGALPSAVTSGNILGQLSASGYGATGWGSGTRARITFLADENWSDTAQGASIAFQTTPNTTVATATQLSISNAGVVNAATQLQEAGSRVWTASTLPLPTCTAAQKVTSNGTALSCATDLTGAGGGGTVNSVIASLNLGNGKGWVYTTTVAAPWVTGTSPISCTPWGTALDGQTVETYYVADFHVTVGNQVAGVGFDIAVINSRGASGTFRFSCIGG